MSIRFKIHHPGVHTRTPATLSGVEWRDLRSAVNMATIHCLESLQRHRSAPEPDLEAIAWTEHMRTTLSMIDDAISQGIANTWPKHPERPPTKEERWAKLRAERKFEEWMTKMLQEARGHHVE